MYIKRALRIGGILCLVGLLAAAAGESTGIAADVQRKGWDDRPGILATTFPAYDFARALVGNWVDVQLLLPPGVESHTYDPTPQDILRIQQAELFVYTGGESEHWVLELLDTLGADAPRTLAMADCVSGERFPRSGWVAEEVELDEHVWTSPRNVKRIVEELGEVIAGSFLLPGKALKEIETNKAAYLRALDGLDESLQRAVAEGSRDKIVFGDRFPFRHLAVDYGLRFSAAIPGCSEDGEPSAHAVVSLIREIRQEKIPVVFYIEFSNRETAMILAEETGACPMLLHSCHNVTLAEMEAGATYLSLMEQNVGLIREALR